MPEHLSETLIQIERLSHAERVTLFADAKRYMSTRGWPESAEALDTLAAFYQAETA